MTHQLAPVTDAVEAIRSGRPALVVDDADRENEGDVILAAQHATPEWIGWTVRHTSGVLCAPMTDDIADALHLPAMVDDNQDPRGTAYTVSVDARYGVTTGISATDRARTLRLLADPETTPADLTRPGHVFGLRARPGGVLERPGHTEAALDLCLAAGLRPVGVLAEIVGDDGEPLRLPGILELGEAHGLPVVSIADMAAWRRAGGGEDPAPTPVSRVVRIAAADLPTRQGRFQAVAYRDRLTGAEHLVVVPARPRGVSAEAPLVRVHSECLTGDGLGSVRCDCGPQLDTALRAIAEDPAGGALVYLRGQEGRGIGLAAKIAAYALQDDGLDTVDANLAQGLPVDAREYGAAAAILADLGLERVRLLTNNPAKVSALTERGIAVAERIPLVVGAEPSNAGYLRAKRDRMGHLLPANLGLRPVNGLGGSGLGASGLGASASGLGALAAQP